jgi:hypothetical protein
MRPSVRFVTSFLFCLSLVALAGGCKKGRDVTHRDPGGFQCEKATSFSRDLIAVTFGGGGMTGGTRNRMYFADGRVVTSWTKDYGQTDGGTETVTLPAARMAKLDRDLAKILVKAKQGCWVSEPMPDGTDSNLLYQHNGTTYQFSAFDSMVMPDHMREAFGILHDVDKAVDEAIRLKSPS